MDYIYELDDSFMHSGIKGQKWGQRRYQNSDGSLTPEGRLHYGIGKMRTAAKNYGAQAKYKAKKLGIQAGLAADKYGRAASVAARNYGAQASYKAKKMGVQAGLAADKYGAQAKAMAGRAASTAALAGSLYGARAKDKFGQYKSLAKQRAGEYGARAKTMAGIARNMAGRKATEFALAGIARTPSIDRGKQFLKTVGRQANTRYMSYRDAMKANADTVESGNSWINQRSSASNRSSNYNSVGNSENNYGALRRSKYPDSDSRDAFRNSLVASPGKTTPSSYNSTAKPFDTTRARTVSIKSGSRKGRTLTFGGHDRSGGNTPSTGLDSWKTLNNTDFSTSYPRDDNYRRRY